MSGTHCDLHTVYYYSHTVLTVFHLFQVDSPLNLKHPHDVVIFMRQETRVNYLKKLEVCDLTVLCSNMSMGFTLNSHSLLDF